MSEACKWFARGSAEVGVASHLMAIIAQGKNEADIMAKNVAESLHTSLEELEEWALVGDPAELTKRLEAYDESGVSYHVLNFGTKVRDEAGMELFAREVLPSFA